MNTGLLSTLLTGAGVLLLVCLAIGLFGTLRRTGQVDRMMGVQLLGSGAIAVLLLLFGAGGGAALLDVALTLAVLAAFAAVALHSARPPTPPRPLARARSRKERP